MPLEQRFLEVYDIAEKVAQEQSVGGDTLSGRVHNAIAAQDAIGQYTMTFNIGRVVIDDAVALVDVVNAGAFVAVPDNNTFTGKT
jgi:hypothetical protein